jgi:thiamine-phosphate pyrophosphorylase
LTRARTAPRLYLITDRKATGGRALVEVITAALAGIAGSGLDPADVAVQLREKDLGGRALTELGRALRATTAAAGVRLFVNDRIDVALAVGADGVHLGGTSLAPAEAHAIAPGLEVALSTHGIADVRAAGGDSTRAAFAVFGPIRDTPSKRPYGPPLG